MAHLPLFVEEDISKQLEVTCPICNLRVRTQGNACLVWIVTHAMGDGNCPASGREVRRAPNQ